MIIAPIIHRRNPYKEAIYEGFSNDHISARKVDSRRLTHAANISHMAHAKMPI
jgi:hypothetical protein